MNQEKLSARLKDKRGTVTVVVVLAMLVLIGFAAFAIDVGYMMVGRNQLQNIADTAALAAAGELGASYTAPGMTLSAQLAYTPDAGALLTVAQSVANRTGISGVTILSSDFRLGKWNFATHTFTPATTGPTAVNVTARKDNVANGPITTLLAGVLGIGSFNVSATATASLAPPNYIPPCALPLPVGISLAWFSDPDVYCNNPIKLYPTNDPEGCAGWHVYDQTPSSANTLRDTIDRLNDGTCVSPGTTSGVTQFDFTGGNIANALSNMATLFDTMKVKNDGVLDKDNDSTTWTAAVPVYNSTDCSNPHGTMEIVGFSTIKITSVTSPPDPQVIWAQVVCNSIISGSGGGFTSTMTYGDKPNLVQ